MLLFFYLAGGLFMAKINTYVNRTVAPNDNDLVPFTILGDTGRADAPKGVYLIKWSLMKSLLQGSQTPQSGLPAGGETGDALFRNTTLSAGAEWDNPIVTQFPRGTLIEGAYRTSVTQQSIPFGGTRNLGQIDTGSANASADYLKVNVIPIGGNRTLLVNPAHYNTAATATYAAKIVTFDATQSSVTYADATLGTGVSWPSEWSNATNYQLAGWLMPNDKTVIVQHGSQKIWILNVNSTGTITELRESSIALPYSNGAGVFGSVMSGGEFVFVQTDSTETYTRFGKMTVGDNTESLISSDRGSSDADTFFKISGNSAGGGGTFEDGNFYYAMLPTQRYASSISYLTATRIAKTFTGTTTPTVIYKGISNLKKVFSSVTIGNGDIVFSGQDSGDHYAFEKLTKSDITTGTFASASGSFPLYTTSFRYNFPCEHEFISI